MRWWVWAAGAAAGAASVRLALLPDRWVVAVLAGAWTVAGVLASGRVRRTALVVFVLSLQIGLALYLTEPGPAPSVGSSWPNSLAAPLPALTAAGALLARPSGPWFWGGAPAAWAAAVAGTTAVSVLGSPEPWIGVCHVFLIGAFGLILLAGANCVQDAADLNAVQRALRFSLALQSLLYGLQTLLGATFTPAGEWLVSEDGWGRYGGTVAARPAMFCSFLLPLVLAALAHVLTSGERGVWRRYGLPAAMGTAAVILTVTRASWMGLMLGVGYLAVAAGRRGWLRRGRTGTLACICVGIGLALSPKILARVSDDHQAAVRERWALVQMAWRVIQAHPLAGAGAGAYPYVFRDYLTPELSDRWLYVVHNVYVLRAAETGAPGAAAWVMFLIAAFRAACPERMRHPAARRFALGWRAGLVALSWEMLWDVSLGPAVNSMLWFLCGVMAAAARLPGPDRSAAA